MLRNAGAVSVALGLTLIVFAWRLTQLPTADAQDPSSTPAAELGLLTDEVIGQIGEEPKVKWQAVEGVDHFELAGTLTAVRVNKRDPFCTRPLQSESTTISINESLPETTIEFTVAFPQLPEMDGWFVSLAEVRLQALSADGEELGAQGGGGTAEAICSRPTATNTPSPRPQLPSTGSGQNASPKAANWTLVLSTGVLLLAAGLALSTRH